MNNEYNQLAYVYDQFMPIDLLTLYVDLIEKYKKEASVIDFGCGTGTLGVQLSLLGYDVVLTDKSSNMLEVAYNKAIEEETFIELYVHDILSHPVEDDFDVVLCTTDTINYISNDLKTEAFENMYHSLAKDGIFLFDFLKESYFELIEGHKEIVDIPGGYFDWKIDLDDATKTLIHSLKFYDEQDELTIDELHLQQTVSKEKYLAMLEYVGLKVIEEIDLEERLVFVCKKA